MTIERSAQRRRHVAGDKRRAAQGQDAGHCRARPQAHLGSNRCRRRRHLAVRSSSASRMAPRAGAEIGDAQGARARAARHRSAASAASTTVSVSGRGTSVAASTRSCRLQNSFVPMMRATGSWARRRCASAAIARLFVGVKLARARARQAPAWSRPSAWPTRSRASSSGESMPAARNFAAHARRARPSIVRAVHARGVPRRGLHQSRSSAASSAAWFSATSASMISPSASPSRICGSL